MLNNFPIADTVIRIHTELDAQKKPVRSIRVSIVLNETLMLSDVEQYLTANGINLSKVYPNLTRLTEQVTPIVGGKQYEFFYTDGVPQPKPELEKTAPAPAVEVSDEVEVANG